jgi:hypothetical protein
MRDVVTITRPTGVDELTGAPTGTQIYTGAGRVQTYEPTEVAANVGEGTVVLQRYSVHIPIGVCEPQPGDLIDVTRATHDPALTGRRYVVRGLLHKSFATAQRLLVDDRDEFAG